MTPTPPPVLERIWDDLPIGPAPVEQLLTTGHAARRRRRAIVAGAALTGAVMIGVGIAAQPFSGSQVVDGQIAGTPTADAPPPLSGTFDPIDLTPKTAQPRALVSMGFPKSGMRGIAFSLDKWEDGEWQAAYYLTSDGGSLGWEPSWWSLADAEGRGWRDIGVSGPGPDQVIVPNTATNGFYRLCTANAVEEACGLLEVNSSAASVPGGRSATVLLTGDGGRDAKIVGTLTRVGDCAGIGDQVGIWPLGTTVVRESPLTLNIPGLGEIQAGDELVGAGGVFDAAVDDVAIEIPASCGTTQAVTFRPE